MTLWRSQEIEAATGGRATRPFDVQGVSIDTRTLERGDLFVALHGEHRDAHAFVADALARQAAAAMVARVPEDVDGEAPLIVVDDTLQGLRDLGCAARARCSARGNAAVLGLTGSVGKTGVKSALKHVLSRQTSTHASAASYNNHWGVPLSLARTDAASRYAIFEMGMNRAGEIADLTRLVRPQVALVIWVASAHLEFFEDEAAIARAKAEIVEGLEPGGIAVLPRDNTHFELLRDKALDAGARVVTFGRHEGSDWRVLDASCAADGSRARIVGPDGAHELRLSVSGQHWVHNAVAVLASVSALGADVARAVADLASYEAEDGRGRTHVIALPGGTATLIDDSYNANPASMKAAIARLGLASGRRVAALGEMRELGAGAAELHAALAQPLREAGVSLVFTYGELTRSLARALPAEIENVHQDEPAHSAATLVERLRPGDTVLVKGSLASGMRRLVEGLERAAPDSRLHDRQPHDQRPDDERPHDGRGS